MHHIIYMSRATKSLTPATLAELLQQARQANEQHHITGALVYGEGQFMQLIEGEQSAVAALYERIAQDPRHEAVFKVADKAISTRSFTEWSMAFQPISLASFEHLTGYVSPAQLASRLQADSAADNLLLEKMKELMFSTTS